MMAALSDKQGEDAKKAANTRWEKAKASRAPDIPGEEWRPVPNLPGYEASSLGRVRSQFKVLHQSTLKKTGHKFVCPSINGKQAPYGVHRMVCEAFNGPCPEGQECRHDDGDPANNVPSNLLWGTRLENQRDRVRHGTTNSGERNGQAKLTAESACAIYKRAKAGEERAKLAIEFGVRVSQINLIAGGFRWASATGAIPRKR